MMWSFGLNKNVPVLNLTDENRKLIMYTCAHTGVVYDFANNKQMLLQGHVSGTIAILFFPYSYFFQISLQKN